MKKFLITICSVFMLFAVVGCSDAKEPENEPEKTEEKVTIKVFAAASLTDTMEEIAEMYKKKENVEFEFNFDSSGTLKTQIENGAPADIFISAAKKQMNELQEAELLEEGSVVDLLENKVVLIKPKGSDLDITSFEDVATDKVAMVAIGNNDVPVGQYTETIYTNLGLWDAIQGKANLGTNVRQVLDWVATGNADCGVVYATDAAIEENVEVVTQAPEGSCDRVIYPAGIVKDSENKEATQKFLEFLQTKEATEIFEKYGFKGYTE